MYDIVTIGAATRDIFLKSPLFKIVHDPKHLEKLGFPTGEAQCFALGGKIEVGQPIETIGGGAANAAVTFSRQGFKVATLVKIARDRNGEAVMDNCKKENVALLPLFDKKVGTAYSVILLSSSGERTILNFRGASEDIKQSEVPFAQLKARWAYISTGKIHLPVMKSIITHLRKNNVKIAMNLSRYYLNMGLKALRPILSELDVILLNREEAAYLMGCKYEEEEKIFKKFDEVVKGIAVMTDGPLGVLVSDGRTIYHAGIFKEKKIEDRTGAGDAFGSGFVTALIGAGKIDEKSIREAIRVGSANATSVVEYIGATQGVLRKKDIKNPRWKKLSIKIRTI